MKTIGLVVREEIVKEIKNDIKEAKACVFINFNKVKAAAMSQLRNRLRIDGASIYVAKNSLLEKAFDNTEKNNLDKFLSNETGVIFIYDKDVVKVCKTLVDFSKENEVLQIRGGFLKDKALTVEELNVLAKLPPKEVLLGMVVDGIASPLTGFLSTLNQIILKFMWVLQEVKKNKEKNKK